MPSWGNATIGEQPDQVTGDAVQQPVAVNRLPALSAGMGNAHVGGNYSQVVEPARAGLIAADQTPGYNGNLAHIHWELATGQWQPGAPVIP